MDYRRRREALSRTSSICPSPEELLLEFVKKNDCQSIRKITESNKALLQHIYDAEYNKPILLIALTEDLIKPETIETLIDCGADLYYASELDEQWEAVHFAAYKTNSRNLKVIVENLEPGAINTTAKGNNALHVLIKYGQNESEKEFSKCAEILVEAGINVNQGDEKNVSPTLWAAKKGYADLIKIIFEYSAGNVDVDSHSLRGKTARDLINEKNLYNLASQNIYGNNNGEIEPVGVMFSYLKTRNETGFVNYKNGNINDLVDSYDTSNTLLQMSCEKGLKKAVEHLLNNGADPNKTIERNPRPPIKIVCEHGFYEIFKLLLDHPHIVVPKDILNDLLKNIDNEDYEKCYNLLIDKQKQNRLFDINHTDESKNSPLHYAVRYADPKVTEELLKLGASLASKNKYGFMPIQDIESKLLEKHLDDCVEFDTKNKKYDKEEFMVTFNYRTLIPPVSKAAIKADDTETGHSVAQELVAETELIAHMSRSQELKHLLKHPVIVSFLFMKWHRICWLFYTNLAFYITFFLSLVLCIFTSYINFSKDKAAFVKIIGGISWALLGLTTLILIIRELFQIAVAPRKYLKNFENYIEICLIIVTCMILGISDASDDTRKQLSSLAILMAAFELVLMVGQHPKLTTNVVMLKTVSFNFFKFLLWYSLLIIAFALSFYILFADFESENLETATTKINVTSEDDDSFSNPAKSVFKTIVMLTGEFDAGSINFDTFPVTSKLIFSLFIFMIAIILLNLLNGLAVSDTQTIRSDAELVGHIARAQHVYYVESMVLGNVLPSNIIRGIQSLCCCLSIDREKLTLAAGKSCVPSVCLFPQYLNYELSFYPNKQGLVAAPKTNNNRRMFTKCCCISCSTVYLDKDTIRRTNIIVQERRDAIDNENQVKNFEVTIAHLERKMDQILDRLKYMDIFS